MGFLSRRRSQLDQSGEHARKSTSLASEAGAQILGDERRRDLVRIGRERYGPPYPGSGRIVDPSAAEILLDTAAAMGIPFPTPSAPDWNAYETRLCSELRDAAEEHGGWAIAGALYVAVDLDVRSDNPRYLELLDLAADFLHREGVPADHVPRFVLDRWNAAHGRWPDQHHEHAVASESEGTDEQDNATTLDLRPTDAQAPSADEADVNRKLGEALRDSGDIDGAELLFREAVEGGDLEALHQLACLLEDQRKDSGAAEATWRRADDAGSALGAMMLGVSLRGRGQAADAAVAFARAEERGHKDAAASMGSILEDQGDLAGAEAAYRRADASGSIFGAFNLGLLLMARGDRAGAEAAWQNADDRGDAEGAANLGSLLRQNGDVEGAEAAYRRADDRGSALGAWQLGELLEARGERAEAQGVYERAADRGSAPGAFALASMHIDQNVLQEARVALARAEELGHPNASEMLAVIARAEAQAALEIGAAKFNVPSDVAQMGKDMAIQADEDPVRFITYHEARRLYAHQGVPTLSDRSETELRDASAHGDLSALVELGLVLERRGDIEAALEAFADAAERGDAYAVFRLGFIEEVHRRNDQQALRYYRVADEAGDANGAGNVGRLLKARGDLVGAEQAFGRCFERGGTRALADHAGLMSNRNDATHDEIRDVVAKLCGVEDLWVEAESHDRATGNDERKQAVQEHTSAPVHVFGNMWDYCDAEVMEAGVRAADADRSASGAYHLGILLRDRGDLVEAAQASLRAGSRGYAAGWTNAAVALSELGNNAGAERAARRGDALGEVDSTVLLALCLDSKGDSEGAIDANRRADAAGSASGALHLGVALVERGDLDEAERAFIRAQERGEPKGAQNLEILRNMR